MVEAKSKLRKGNNYSYSLSLIRLIALILIIVCHIMQYYNFVLAWWFNVGVQIFLCLSGYLYSQKEIKEISNYYIKRFRKILVPYYILLFFVILIHKLMLIDEFSNLDVIRALFLNATICSGGKHLWFVPTILLCYCFTPILNSFYEKVGYDRKHFIFTTFCLLLSFTLFIEGFADFYNSAWISCYVIGYSIGIIEINKLWSKHAVLITFGMFSIMNLLQIYYEYFFKTKLNGWMGTIISGWEAYNHVFLGIFIFLIIKFVFGDYLFSQFEKKILNISDKYSYEAYLVHQFCILGHFSMLEITRSFIIKHYCCFVFYMHLCILVKKDRNFSF